MLDVSLPDGDGFELVEQLREDGRLASTPLVVYTASDLTAEDRARLTLGDTEVLLKSTVALAQRRPECSHRPQPSVERSRV